MGPLLLRELLQSQHREAALAGSAEGSTESLKAGTARSPWRGDSIKSSVWKTEPASVDGQQLTPVIESQMGEVPS